MRAIPLVLIGSILLLAPALPLPVVGPDAAWAGKKDEAEKQRLLGDMQRLAGRGAWTGVTRKYAELVDLGLGVPAHAHLLAYQAARTEGDLAAAHACLVRAVAAGDPGADPSVQEAASALEGLESSYGLVRIEVGSKRIPALVRPEMPFSPDARKAIEHAQGVLADQRSFEGLLPAGRYMVDGTFFEVSAGGERLEVEVR